MEGDRFQVAKMGESRDLEHCDSDDVSHLALDIGGNRFFDCSLISVCSCFFYLICLYPKFVALHYRIALN